MIMNLQSRPLVVEICRENAPDFVFCFRPGPAHASIIFSGTDSFFDKHLTIQISPMSSRTLNSNAASATVIASARKLLAFIYRYKWTVGGSLVLGGTAYYISKLLRYVPVREMLIMIAESEDKADLEMKAVLRGGEACRILKV